MLKHTFAYIFTIAVKNDQIKIHISKLWNFAIAVKEIEEMIVTVDKNNDGKINYSEFRVGFANELNWMR